MPTSNNPPNWSKDRTPHADNPVFHIFIPFGPFVAHPFFFLFLSQLHTRILLNLRHLFLISRLTILSVSLYLYSLSYLSIWCACVVIYVACSWYTPPSQKSFSFSFLFFPHFSQDKSTVLRHVQTDSIFFCPSFLITFLNWLFALAYTFYVFA